MSCILKMLFNSNYLFFNLLISLLFFFFVKIMVLKNFIFINIIMNELMR